MLKKVIVDLFQNSKYYKKTPARSIDVVEPLGYAVIHQLDTKLVKKGKPTNQKKKIVEFPQAIFPKSILNKKGPQNQDDFCIRQAGRKNQIAGGQNFKQLKDKQEWILQNRKLIKFFNNGDQELLKYIELLQYISRDHLFTIHDYAISQYHYFCQCSNPALRNYLNSYFNHEIVEYTTIPTYVQSNFSSEESDIQKVDIQSLEDVMEMIRKLEDKNNNTDEFYCGYHIFLGLEDMPVVEGENFDSEESRFLKYLQYYILMITCLLADGQLAILKTYSSFYQKTNEYIYLLRWMFNKITIIKPMLSNHLDHQKFIICEGFRKSAGDKVNKLIKQNYDLLKEYGQTRLLIKQEVIDKTQYKNFMTEYNNKVLYNEFKRLNEMLNDNPNTFIRPHQQFLLQKLKKAYNPNEYVTKSLERLFAEKRLMQQQQAQMKEEKKMIVEEPVEVTEPVSDKKTSLLSVLGRKKNIN